jgi:hypothetical protein
MITGVDTDYAVGGAGRAYTSGANGTSGAANTGNGGQGGAGSSGVTAGAGGSGVVIIAYPTATYPQTLTITGTLTHTLDTTTRSGYNVYKFTSGTGTVYI